jgi:magnesium chelatase family protein
MLAKVLSGAVIGLDGILINVEVDITKKGFGAFKIVGLPSKAVDEARDRVKTAIDNTGLDFTKYRLTINLAPADLPKEGPIYDLPIAIGVLAAMEKIDNFALLETSMFMGEMSLDGSLNSTPAILPLTIVAKENGLKNVFVPVQNAAEASIVPGINVYPINNLRQLIQHLNAVTHIKPFYNSTEKEIADIESPIEFGFEDIKGQAYAKRALVVAAAGGHNIMFSGPPGAGKTLLARSLPAIMPSLSWEEALTVTKIHSIAHLVDNQNPLITQRPFRAPHHSVSRAGLIGGSSKLTPGEISIAHRGVLFLDEIPEFPRSVLESLRQPLEDGFITISRVTGSVKFPTSFMLVAASNPCPCGWFGSTKRRCICPPIKVTSYQQRLSGPLLDRIDIHTSVREVEAEEIMQVTEKHNYPETRKARSLIKMARETQNLRFKNLPITTNAEMSSHLIQQFCTLPSDLKHLLVNASNRLGLSARAIHKTLKVARTLADLEACESIESNHITEALNYRKKE